MSFVSLPILRASAAALVFASSLVFGALPVAAQSNNALISIPEESPSTTLPSGTADTFVLTEERFAVDRRHLSDEADDAGMRPWLSPLRPRRVSQALRGQSWRFGGENNIEEFSLFVADPQVAQNLMIYTLSSVNVLPERSEAQVFINGQPTGAVRLQNFNEFEPTEMVIPAGALVAGENTVRMVVNQHHRIFCGPEASFALWSEIDLSRSGLEFDVERMVPSAAAFMMGLAYDANGRAGVEFRGTEGLGEQRSAWVGMLTTRLSNVMSGAPMRFRFTDYWSLEGGVPARSRVTFLPAANNRVTFRLGADAAQVMLIEYIPGSEPTELPVFEQHFAPRPLSERPPLIDVDREVAFSEFGFETLRVSQRYAQRSYAFRLPDDWLVLTASKARLRLDYVYSDGLPEGAMLLLGINGETIRMLPMRGEGGEYITRFPIIFEARLMRAGVNTLDMEMLIPGEPANLPCPAGQGPVLEVADTSTLEAPFSPSMYLPDMSLAFNTFSADSVRANDLTARAFNSDDQIVLSAALSRAASVQVPGTLNLMAIEDLGSVPITRYSLNRRVLEDVLLRPVSLDADGDEIFTTQELDDPFRRVTERREYSAALSTGWEAMISGASRLLQWINPTSSTQLNDWLADRHGQVVLLQLDDNRPDQIWMLRAPDADISAIAGAIISARTEGAGPRGQVSVLDYDGEWHNWVAPDLRPTLLEPITFSNVRYVLGNFVSAMPILFVLLLMLLALISAAFALRLVISTREHDA
jgi:hypothetical protein